MINEKAKQIIENNPVAFATVDESGNPNVIGVAFVKVLEANKILITDNYMTKTKENLSINKNICLASWDKDWNGYKIIGTAEYFSNGEWQDYVKKMPENEGLSAKGAVVITISSVIDLS